MDADNFREFGKEMVDFIANYIENIRERQVLPSVDPGYIRKLLPENAPEDPEKWQDVMKDIERVIMPGITHWHSPRFHAYFPTANSYPAIVGDMLSTGLGVVGFSWMTSPACTELEVVVMDWLGKLLGLPPQFLASSGGTGGGVIQGTASEATLIGLLAARAKILKELKKENPNLNEGNIIGKLVAYASGQSNSSVEKAGLLGAVRMRLLETDSDESLRLRGHVLKKAIEEDKKNGLIPFYVVGTLGTTGTCAFDCLDEIGPICRKEGIWLHVDAAYAGSAFVCPEYRHLMKGVELADSFNINTHKWLLTNFDCSPMWFQNAEHLVEGFNVDRIYLKHQQENCAPDYRHWQIPLGRRFRSLKLWFVLRLYGVKGLQEHIRRQIQQAKSFAERVERDDRFELVGEPSMGLVCFKLKGPCELSERLLKLMTDRKEIYLIPGKVRGKLAIRCAICARTTTMEDLEFTWNEISNQADVILNGENCEETHNGINTTNGTHTNENGVNGNLGLQSNGNAKINGTNGVKEDLEESSQFNGIKHVHGTTETIVTNGVKKTTEVNGSNGVNWTNKSNGHLNEVHSANGVQKQTAIKRGSNGSIEEVIGHASTKVQKV